jgi:ubiquinone/menaquinone biosynthesis C-methylase UbiE
MRGPWYYDVVAPVYDTIVPRDTKGICDSFEDILKRHIKSKQVVDLGCGTGRFAIELARRKYKVSGIDLSEKMLNVARSKTRRMHVRISFLEGDMRNFLLAQKASVIWTRGSIGDLIRLPDVHRALLNIHRNLASKGLFVLDVRDYNQHFRTHKESIVRDTRIVKQRNRTLTFSFVLDLNKKSRIATIHGKVVVKRPLSSEEFRTHHALRYFTEKELTGLLNAAGFELLQIMPGYHMEKGMKPRLVAVAQPR